jgi:molybdopterin molybdotransferase
MMDGYAVRAGNTFGAGRYDPKTLRSVEKIFTGQVPTRSIGDGECAEIATGAPMPQGADAVVMVEETERAAGDAVRIFTPVYPRQNVGGRGSDIRQGQAALEIGSVLTPSRLGALSSIIGAHGGVPVVLPTAQDTIEALSNAIDAALGEDVLVFSGGSSVGERDLIMDVLVSRGEVIFHGIAVKPGKPTVLGRVAGKPVLGMPGNPTSCLSNGYLLLVPMLRRMARLPAFVPQSVRVPLARRIVSTTGRHQFYTVRIVDGRAVPAFKGSGDITSMAHADGYIEIPAQVDIVEADELVDVKLF